jgi:hypothetical protein
VINHWLGLRIFNRLPVNYFNCNVYVPEAHVHCSDPSLLIFFSEFLLQLCFPHPCKTSYVSIQDSNHINEIPLRTQLKPKLRKYRRVQRILPFQQRTPIIFTEAKIFLRLYYHSSFDFIMASCHFHHIIGKFINFMLFT